ncbi:metallophosphoesterase [Campylobacter sp. US33a]|uniref:metallophosphoesterase n=1 Tax=Campylobacter sp. US33a TaxID=2498120 RepID=UPI0010677EB4|nr:metallophosphoesterase [Campylobacter sp. US33a]TEY03475.1 metallophosphoesterase [Campylobacter sp. US33a]
MLFLVFSFGILLLFAIANIYIYKRFILQIHFLKPFKKIFALLLILLFLGQAIFLLFRRDDYLSDFIYGLLASFYAVSYCLFLIALLADLFKILSSFLQNKGLFLGINSKYAKTFFDIFFILLGCFFIQYSINNALGTPSVKEKEIVIPKLKENLKIILLTDIHLGKNLHEDFLQKLIEKVNAYENVDAVVIVGDLIDTKPQNLSSYIHKLDEFKSKYGTFYALGNHEYYHDADEVIKFLKTYTKLNILINNVKILPSINIAGIADLSSYSFQSHIPDIDAIKNKLDPNLPSILLSHQPKSVDVLDLSHFDLILSGHTHAGQIFPFAFLVLLQQGYLHGLYKLKTQNQLYVSSGAGFWGPSFRTLAPSEIVLLNLKGE